MTFSPTTSELIESAGAGKVYKEEQAITLTAAKGEWQDIKMGRFAQIKVGVLQPMDGAASPNVAGVVKYTPVNAIEDGETVNDATVNEVEYVRSGLISVAVKSGQTAPNKFAAVQAYNTAGADLGLAVASGGVATNAEFIEDLGNDVWLIRLK